jgi:hypothetical protein
MEEDVHRTDILGEVRKALADDNAVRLRDLSNQTIRSASYIQDSGSIALAVLIYTVSKLIEREDHRKIKNWPVFVKKLDSWLALATQAEKKGNQEAYESYLMQARKSLTTVSVSVKPYVQDVLHKASINKASKIYEQGISLGKTAQLLGVSPWELTEYASQKHEGGYQTLDVATRAAMALKFFE